MLVVENLLLADNCEPYHFNPLVTELIYFLCKYFFFFQFPRKPKKRLKAKKYSPMVHTGT